MTRHEWAGLISLSPMFFILGWTTLSMMESLHDSTVHGILFFMTAFTLFIVSKNIFDEKNNEKKD